ncbi:MAG: carboxypeptidase regulatory-like domain-containing protein, partial [Limisphaerales bacterium]
MRFKKFAVLSTLIFATLSLLTATAGAVGSISGQVKLEHEVALIPVEGTTVGAISADTYLRGTARPADSHFVAMARTDSNGNYRLENLPAGNYRVVACKEDLGCLFYDGNGGSPYPNFARTVAVVDDQTTTGIDITFRSFVTPPPPNPALITGRITDAQTGEGIADAYVAASGEFLTIIFETRTGPDGRYNLPVTAGGYFVRAAARGYQPGEYAG